MCKFEKNKWIKKIVVDKKDKPKDKRIADKMYNVHVRERENETEKE